MLRWSRIHNYKSRNNFSVNGKVATLCTLQKLSGVCLPGLGHFPHSAISRIVWRNNTYD
jgi:hypothetical protein